MRFPRYLAISASVSAIAVACHSDSLVAARDVDRLFQTDSTQYSIRRTDGVFVTEIGVTFTNTTGHTVYFVNCLGGTSLVLEKLVGDQWEYAWGGGGLDCLSAPITVNPGATYRRVIRVWAAHRGTNSYPQFAFDDLQGDYRILWHDAMKNFDANRSGFGDRLPLSQRVSNRFAMSVRP